MARITSSGMRYMLLAGIAAGLFVRWAVPSADPPLHRQTGAILYDEVWGFAARNAVLWGAWQQDEWRPWVVCPVHTILLEGAFRTFGMTPFGLRFLAMLSGTLILLYTYLMARIARYSVNASLCAAFVLATSWTMTGFSKTMTLEPSVMHFFAAALLFIVVGESRTRTRLLWYFIAGICTALATLCKTSGLPMALSLSPYLLFGAVAHHQQSRWRPRILRLTVYLIGFVLTLAFGFWRWIVPDLDSFYRLAIQTSLLDRAQNPLFMRAYKAVFWLDSQAFLTTPFWLCVLFLLLPIALAARNTTAIAQDEKLQTFVTGLMSSAAIIGLLLMVNVDVPARRLVYLSIPLALLTAALWDAIARLDASANDHAIEPRSVLYRACSLATAVVAGLLAIGWLMSPNGGLPSFVIPLFAAWLLFDMNAKLTYKIIWLLGGALLGFVFWQMRAQIWRNRRTLFLYALVAHAGFYLIASGLWFARISYTGLEASQKIGEIVPRGAYILGADAAAQGYFNASRPIFWSPKGYRFANYDEAKIEQDFNPEFLLLTSLDLERLQNGTYRCSPYIASFLRNEIARFPMYEYHESLSLSTQLVLMRRQP